MFKNIIYLFSILIISVILVVSCSDSDNNSSGNIEQSPELVSIYPQDGAINVDPETSISMRFKSQMDTITVRRYCFIADSTNLHMWMDSIDYHGGMGHMQGQQHHYMMNWADSIRIGGQYHFNQQRDSCMFVPDSSFHPSNGYMIMLVVDSIMNHSGHRMGQHMGMGHNQDNLHYFNFRTGDGS